MNFLRLHISNISEEVQELLIAQLSQYPFDGFEQKESHLLAYAKENELDEKDILTIIQTYEYSIEYIPTVNWNEKWEQDFTPIQIENVVAIRAHFHKPITTVENEIIITPKMLSLIHI